MKILRSIAEVREFRKGVGRVGFVPTMGALHAGHLHLMERAVAENDVAVGSIFVNPLQFGPKEDLSKYPRQESIDLEKSAQVGMAAMFCPGAEEMVGSKSTSIVVGGVSDLFEGERRPGHFEGVATIVAQLFGIVQPTTAYFGLKDLQQCAVIQRMVHDLSMPVELHFVETVREESGLAMSSRNEYFSPEQRQKASQLYGVLQKIAKKITKDRNGVDGALAEGENELAELGFGVEYLEVVDPAKMVPVRVIDQETRLIVAARYYSVRLIDNISILK